MADNRVPTTSGILQQCWSVGRLTRQRLAEGWAKNRSFISQITNAKYSVPIPQITSRAL